MAELTLIHGGAIRKIQFMPPARLYDLLAQNSTPLHAPCGGHMRCNRCVVTARGALSEQDETESALLANHPDKRLACRTIAVGDALVISDTLQQNAKIQTDGYTPEFSITQGRDGCGVAVDVGTTTIAAYLYDLSTGVRTGAESSLNPQAAYGADVITRIGASLDGRGPELARLVCDTIASLTRSLVAKASVSIESLRNMIITGNTAMLYLMCGIDPKPLSAMPFHADNLFGEYRFPCALDLPLSVSVYLPRCAAAYVGADITCAALAGGLIYGGEVSEGPPRMLIDIGTNGEIMLAADGALLCCATAAGPAFEGAGISCGSLAVPGAIDRCSYADGKIQYSTIDGAPPIGLCGTGLVDAAAALLDAGLLDETGYMEDDFTFADSSVTVTQKDIRALQLAKSAIQAGMLTLLHESRLSVSDIDSLIIAGGFGSHINAASAERIGLIPKGLACRAQSIGNGAGTGAGMILLSDEIRAGSESIDRIARIVDLSTHPVFMDAYVEGMMFE